LTNDRVKEAPPFADRYHRKSDGSTSINFIGVLSSRADQQADFFSALSIAIDSSNNHRRKPPIGTT
jgi:hypothetical protein